MAGFTGSHRVPYIVLRAMRRPLFVLVAVYAASMLGWRLIPGPDGVPLSFFHAFYFLAYTATTTGFGEIPYLYTDLQRMWAIVSLYAGVIAWVYAIGAIIQLIQNPHFQQALAERGFAKRVAMLTEPFVIVCGFGNRGSLLTRGLSDAGLAAVILDRDPDRIHAVKLRDYAVPAEALCADARIPERLIKAGLLRSQCRAVVALTDDEDVNAKVALAARLLNPHARVIAQLTRDEYEETLATLGGDIHIVDPFHTFARYLGATIHNPLIHMLNEWLIGAPHANLAMYADIPRGKWILCGFGRLGRAIHATLQELGIRTVVIDSAIPPTEANGRDIIAGRINQKNLRAAGIEDAAGIVVGTDSDSDNLGTVLNARALNPRIFVLVRQNQHRNQVLFDGARADLIMQPTLVSARRILFLLTAPLLRTFFNEIRESQAKGHNEFLLSVIRDLHDTVGGRAAPRLWTVRVEEEQAPALAQLLDEGHAITFDDILSDPADRNRRVSCVPLVIRSKGATRVMPDVDHRILRGDEILFCGRSHACRLVDATLANPYTLRYLMTGVEEPRSLVLRWLARRHAAASRVPG